MTASNLIEAAYHDNVDALKLMIIEEDHSPNCTGRYKENAWTPLVAAVYRGHLKAVRFLVENGADVNFQDSDGWSPLYAAVAENRQEIIDYLLENGANPRLKNNKKKSALSLAQEKSHTLYRQILEHAGWVKTDAHAIQNYSTAGEFEVTHHFNFKSMQVTSIYQDPIAKTQSHQTLHFSDSATDKASILQAKEELLKQNGVVDIHDFTQALKSPRLPQNIAHRQISRRK